MRLNHHNGKKILRWVLFALILLVPCLITGCSDELLIQSITSTNSTIYYNQTLNQSFYYNQTITENNTIIYNNTDIPNPLIVGELYNVSDEDLPANTSIVLNGPDTAVTFRNSDNGLNTWDVGATYEDEVMRWIYIGYNYITDNTLITGADSGLVAINKEDNILEDESFFNGTGLNYFHVSGLFTGEVPIAYKLTMLNNTVVGYQRSIDGSSFSSYIRNWTIDVNTNYDLERGIVVNWSNTSFLRQNQTWVFVGTPQDPQATFSIGRTGFFKALFYNQTLGFVDQTFASQTSQVGAVYDDRFPLLNRNNSLFYIGYPVEYKSIAVTIAVAGVGVNRTISFCNSTNEFQRMNLITNSVSDGTNNFTISGTISWDITSFNWSNNCSVNGINGEYWLMFNSTTQITTSPQIYSFTINGIPESSIFDSPKDIRPRWSVDSDSSIFNVSTFTTDLGATRVASLSSAGSCACVGVGVGGALTGATTGAFSSTLSVTGATTLSSTLAVTGATTLANTLTLSKNNGANSLDGLLLSTSIVSLNVSPMQSAGRIVFGGTSWDYTRRTSNYSTSKIEFRPLPDGGYLRFGFSNYGDVSDFGYTERMTLTPNGSLAVYSEPFGVEILRNGDFNDSTNWTTTGGWFVNSTGKNIQYLFNSTNSLGNLVQLPTNMSSTLMPHTRYRLIYNVSVAPVGACGIYVPKGVAVTDTPLTNISGVNTWFDIVFKTSSNPSNFTLSAVCNASGNGFRLDGFSLKAYTGGSIETHGKFTGGNPDAGLDIDVYGNATFDSNVNISGNLYAKIPYAMFSDLTHQTIAVANTPYPVNFSYTEDAYLINVSSDRQNISFKQSGDYSVFISGIVSTDLPNKHIEIWLEKNGVNVPRSNTKVELTTAGTEVTLAVPFIIDMNTTDVMRVMWASDDAGSQLVYTTNTSYSPESPSIIMTISKNSEITP